ncbi:MAG: hypothetical protein Q9218_002139 [Villophora microphyllina]
MAAVAVSAVGRSTDNVTLVAEGTRKYGQALRELQRALWDPRLMCLDETLAACSALVLYELLECTANNMQAWASHAQGVARLMEARGPDSWSSPLAHTIFKNMRHSVVRLRSGSPELKADFALQMIHDLQSRVVSVLMKPEWQSGPWKEHVKSPDQQLYDVGIALTGILARAYTTKSISDNSTFAWERAALVQECQDLDGKLDDWFGQLSEDIPTPHYWPEFSRMETPSNNSTADIVFPVSFHFPNIYVAKLLIDYWAISIMLHSTIKLLYQSLAGVFKPNRPEHPADDQGARAKAILSPGYDAPLRKKIADPTLLKSLGKNIAQSMEYCLSNDMGILGPQWALFGLRVALQTYRYGPPSKELQWLQAIHDRISDQKGLRYSRILAASGWQDAMLNWGY